MTNPINLDCDRLADFINVLTAVTGLALADQQNGKKLPDAPSGAKAGRILASRLTLPGGTITHITYRGVHLKAFTGAYNAVRFTERLNKI